MKKYFILLVLLFPWFEAQASSEQMPSVDNQLYKEECSACHMAYQPGFLPARSWEKLMSSLDDHFGENAELDDDARKTITGYLTNNAADHSSAKLAKKFLKRISNDDMPLRISKLNYFIKEHDEIKPHMVTDNPKVKSFSRCETCHRQADEGSYAEKEIDIPDFGKWED